MCNMCSRNQVTWDKWIWTGFLFVIPAGFPNKNSGYYGTSIASFWHWKEDLKILPVVGLPPKRVRQQEDSPLRYVWKWDIPPQLEFLHVYAIKIRTMISMLINLDERMDGMGMMPCLPAQYLDVMTQFPLGGSSHLDWLIAIFLTDSHTFMTRLYMG